MQYASKRITNLIKSSIFEEFTALSIRTKSKNMAQGFPDWDTPKFVRDGLANATHNHENQYLRVAGHLDFVDTIAKEYSQRFNRQIDPLKEIVVGNGATSILAHGFCSLLNEGEEMISFEPGFEFYFSQTELYGGRIRYLPMIPPTGDSHAWKYDFDLLERTITDKTRVLLLNTPHNPTGKMLTEEEIKSFIQIIKKHPNLIVFSDEVYEHMIYEGRKHLRFGMYEDMWDRTLSIYSPGKTFSCTGWRIGFGIGPESLIKPIIASTNWINFCTNRPTQVAISEAMKKALNEPYQGSNNFYKFLESDFQRKKDRLCDILNRAPFNYKVLNPEGGFFVLVDISNSIEKIPIKYFYKEGTSTNDKPVGTTFKSLKNPDHTPDYAFCKWLTFEYGVTPIPLSTFYDNSQAKGVQDYRVTNFVRFAICKSDETLDEVEKRLLK